MDQTPAPIEYLSGGTYAEKEQYDSRVKVLFNEEAYANEEVILQWITEQLIPTVEQELSPSVQLNSSSGCAFPDMLLPRKSPPALISLDTASFNKTPRVLQVLKSNNITPALIPGGCTSLIHVLDVSVNRCHE